jgi:hypothetical protein
MLSRAEQFRERVIECREHAEQSTDSVDKNYWLMLAEQWGKMAQEEAEMPGPRGLRG